MKVIPIHFGEISDGKMSVLNRGRFDSYIKTLEGKDIEIVIRKRKKTRTNKQNRALHLYFSQLAKALNDAGYDMKKTIRKDVDIPWTGGTVKEFLWRPIQIGHLQIESSTQLKTDDIDKVYDIVNRVICERTGIHIPFPNMELLMEEESNSQYSLKE